MRLFLPGCIFLGFVMASVTGSAFGAEMNAAAINSAEPSKKTLSDTKPTPAGIRLQVLLDTVAKLISRGSKMVNAVATCDWTLRT
jgi:hypothetical protein